MKLAYPITTPEIRGRLLAWSGSATSVGANLRSLGYDAVELFVRDPEAFDQDAFARDLDQAGVGVVAVGTGPVAVHDGLTFTESEASRRATAIRRTCAIIDFATRWGAQVNVGKLRGMTGGDASAEARRDEAFHVVCEHAKSRGVAITLEPQCRAVIDNLNDSLQALQWLRSMRRSNLKLMLDSFHMRAEDTLPPSGVFAAAKDALIHIHLSDTKRLPPGRGEIDFPGFLAALRDIGYDGGLTVEIEQQPDSCGAAAEAVRFLRPLIPSSKP